MHKQKYSFRNWLVLPLVALLAIAVFTVLNLARPRPVQAAVGINEQVNYQGRLLTSTGAVVPDGSYNMEFKIYQDGDGVLGGGDETLKWTETRESGNKVLVKNGYFSVYLGSVTAFASNVDWNQSVIWLSINIGGTGSPSYDGQMSPFTRFSSTPYALNTKYLGGLDKTGFVQNQNSGQQATSNFWISGTGRADTSFSTPLLSTASGNLLLDPAGDTIIQGSTANNTASSLKVTDSGGTNSLLLVRNDGNVGIGTASPGKRLTVSNGVANQTTALDDAGFYISRTVDGAYQGSITRDATSTANTIVMSYDTNGAQLFKTSGSTVLAIHNATNGAVDGNSGNLSVPTVSRLLNLNGLANNALTILSDDAAGGSNGIILNRTNRTSAGDNAVAVFQYNSSELVRVATNGNVGIGDTTPDARLDVEPTGAVTTTSYAQRIENLQTNTTTDAIDKYGLHITSTGSFTGSGGTATNNYGLFVATPTGGDNNYAASFQGGNVGIGTVSPSSPLHVSNSGGTQATFTGTAGQARINIDAIGADVDSQVNFLLDSGTVFAMGVDDSDSDKFKISANAALGSSDILTITTAGLVGIGTAGPTQKVEISAPASSTNGIMRIIDTDDGGNPHLVIQPANSGDGIIRFQKSGISKWGFVDRSTSNTAIARIFAIQDANGNGDVATFLGSGAFGIGTTTPTDFLSVSGGARIGLAPAALTQINDADGITSGETSVTVDSTSSYPTAGTLLIDSEAMTYTGKTGTSFTGLTRGVFGTTAAAHSDNATVNIYMLAVNNLGTTAPELAVLGNGNVGVGTTGPDRKLDVLDGSNPQLRLTQADGSVYSDLQTDSSGYLNLTNTGNRITLGTSDTTATLLVLDTKTDAEGALTGVNGATYYNSSSNKFRCYQNGAWTDCIGAGGSTTLQQAYDADADGSDTTISLTTADDSLIFTNPASGGTNSAFVLKLEQLETGPTTAGLLISQSGTNYGLRVDDQASDTTPFIIDATGNVGIGNATPTEKLHVAGNILIDAQADSTAHTYGSGCSCIINNDSTAGKFGSDTAMDGATSSAVYNGHLYVATSKANDAAIYRYDGANTWVRVSDATLGKIITGDTDNIDSINLAVFDGMLYAGADTGTGGATGAVYSYNGSTWSLVNATRGTFAGQTGLDFVSDLQVWNGRLIVAVGDGTTANSAGVYRYDGGTTFTLINTIGEFDSADSTNIDRIILVAFGGHLIGGAQTLAAGNLGRVAQYVGGTAGTDDWLPLSYATTAGGGFGAETNIDDVTAFAVADGQLYVGVTDSTANTGAVYVYRGSINAQSTVTLGQSFVRTHSVVGKLDSSVETGAADIDGITALRTYNGRLYAGTNNANAAAIYELSGTDAADTDQWTVVNSTRGTFGGQANVDSIQTIISFDGNMYVGTSESGAGSVYSWTKTLDNSFALKFLVSSGASGSLSFVGGEQAQGNSNRQGKFTFSNAVALTSGAFDYAEDYPTLDSDLEPGEPVTVDPRYPEHVKRAHPGDTILGVVSENPGLRLSSDATPANGAKWVPIALVGRVPVKISAENGPIQPGDHLALSNIPGVLKKAGNHGQVVGSALEAYSGTGTSKIMMYVNPTFYVSDEWLAQVTNTVKGVSLSEVGGLTITDDEDDVMANIDRRGNATFAGTLTADKIKANQIEGLTILTDRIGKLEERTDQAAQNEEASTETTPEINSNSEIKKLLVDALKVTSDLEVEGKILGGALTLSGPADFNDTVIFQRLATFNYKVIFNQGIQFIGRPTFNKDTGGFATIKEGHQYVEIKFTNEYSVKPVVSAAITDEQFISYTIKDVNEKGFIIELKDKAVKDVQLNWTAIAIDDPKTIVSQLPEGLETRDN